MGNMSASDASDAAPLPRLGEVFFDVRGSARSLRLSWYADTEVAVFSIWQAGTCTGTFRLPMGELERMIETLRRGPGGRPSADPAATAHVDPRALGVWDDDEAGDGGRAWDGQRAWDGERAWEDEEAGPPDYAHGYDPGGYPPNTGPYPANTGPYPASTGASSPSTGPSSSSTGPYPAGTGPLDYAGARTNAHYLPEAAGPSYEGESTTAAAISGSDNGETVPGRGRRGKPSESFPYAPPAGP